MKRLPPGGASSGTRSAKAAMSGSTNSICAEGSTIDSALDVSDWPMSSPLVMRRRWSTVMACLASVGAAQAATDARSSTFNLPC